MYDAVKFLHVLGVFAFLMAHGASASMLFRLRRERDPEKIRTLLDLSCPDADKPHHSIGGGEYGCNKCAAQEFWIRVKYFASES